MRAASVPVAALLALGCASHGRVATPTRPPVAVRPLPVPPATHYRDRYAPLTEFWELWSSGAGAPWQVATSSELLFLDPFENRVGQRMTRLDHHRNRDGSVLLVVNDPARLGTVVRRLDTTGRVLGDTCLDGALRLYAGHARTADDGHLLVPTDRHAYVLDGKTGGMLGYAPDAGEGSWLAPDGSRLLHDDEGGAMSLYRVEDGSLVRKLEFALDYQGDGRVNTDGVAFAPGGAHFFVDYFGVRSVFETATGRRILTGVDPLDPTHPFARDSTGLWLVRRGALDFYSLATGRYTTSLRLPRLSCPGSVEPLNCTYVRQQFVVARPLGQRGFVAYAVVGETRAEAKVDAVLYELSVDAEQQRAALSRIADGVQALAAAAPNGQYLVVRSGPLREARLLARPDHPASAWGDTPLAFDSYYAFSEDSTSIAGYGGSAIHVWHLPEVLLRASLDRFRDLEDTEGRLPRFSGREATFPQRKLDEWASRARSAGYFGARIPARSGWTALIARDRALLLADVHDGRVRAALDGQAPSSFTATFSGDGQRLAVSTRQEVTIYEVASGHELTRLAWSGTGPLRVVLDQQGRRAVLGAIHDRKLVVERRALDGERSHSLTLRCSLLGSPGELDLTLLARDTRLLARSPAGFCVFDLGSGRVLQHGAVEERACVEVREERGELLIGAAGPVVRLSIESGDWLAPLPQLARPPSREPPAACWVPVADGPPGSPLAALVSDTTVALIDPKTGRVTRTVGVPTAARLVALDLLRNELLATADDAETVRVQSLRTGEVIDVFANEGDGVEFSPEGTWLWTSRPNTERRLDYAPPLHIRQSQP